MIDSPQPTTSDLRLAPGQSSDLDKVMEVMVSAFDPRFGEAWTRSQCAGILPMHGVSLMLAHERGRALGFALFRTIAGVAELLLLAVHPEHRRQGVGRRLLDDFIGKAISGGASRVHLEVRDGNPAIDMYESAGFTPAGRRRKYYRGKDGDQYDALTLARKL